MGGNKDKADNEKSQDDGVSDETSKRVCDHMNDDHSVSVYGMAQSALSAAGESLPPSWKISKAELTKVSLKGCDIRVVACSGELCEMRRVRFEFVPPLTSASQLRPCFVEVHHRVLAPKWRWMKEKSVVPLILVVEALLAHGTLVLGPSGLKAAIEEAGTVHPMVSAVFWSPTAFVGLVRAAFWFSVIVHGGEAVYVAYHALRTLKLRPLSALQWFAMICLTGYPVTVEFLPFLEIHRSSQQKRSKKR